MDIADSQIHMGPRGVAETLAAMDALGIAAVLLDAQGSNLGAAD